VVRILASPLFRNSKHYPRLLKYVVEQTLAGHGASLKERALGVEVFGRDAHYDTTADPVVRTSACEVRKRIAQYYQEAGRAAEIRIDLPAGSYVPEFHFPEKAAVETAAVETPALPRFRVPRYTVAAGVVVALSAVGLATAGLGSIWEQPKDAAERFWGPVWGKTDSVMLCLGVFRNLRATGDSPTHEEVMWNDRVAFADAITMAKLTGLVEAHGRKFEIRRGSAFTLEDLRKIPAVLIGAFDNPWTLALSNELRFTFETEAATGAKFIRDLRNPAQAAWRVDFHQPYAGLKEDYAIVSRYMDPRTEGMVVVVAGIGKDGTMAAGDFVTGPRYLEALAASAPKNWERKNLQVVIGTDVINGNSGPPHVLATYFW